MGPTTVPDGLLAEMGPSAGYSDERGPEIGGAAWALVGALALRPGRAFSIWANHDGPGCPAAPPQHAFKPLSHCGPWRTAHPQLSQQSAAIGGRSKAAQAISLGQPFQGSAIELHSRHSYTYSEVCLSQSCLVGCQQIGELCLGQPGSPHISQVGPRPAWGVSWHGNSKTSGQEQSTACLAEEEEGVGGIYSIHSTANSERAPLLRWWFGGVWEDARIVRFPTCGTTRIFKRGLLARMR